MSDIDLPARLVPPEPGAGGRSHWEVTPRGLEIIEEAGRARLSRRHHRAGPRDACRNAAGGAQAGRRR